MKLTVVALFAAYLLTAPAAFSQRPDRVSGIVFDQSGAPIADASVTLFSDEFIRAGTADQDGRFDFDNLPQGPMNLDVSSPGFKTRTMTNIQGGVFGPFVVVLQVGSCPQCLTVTTDCRSAMQVAAIAPPKVSYEERMDDVNVTGNVRDAFGGPLSQATLVLADWSTGSAYVTLTDAKGEFQFRDVEPGKYQLKATRDNYSQGLANLRIARENLTRIDRLLLVSGEEYRNVCALDLSLESSPLPTELIPSK